MSNQFNSQEEFRRQMELHYKQHELQQYNQPQWAIGLQAIRSKPVTGDKPIVVCNGITEECKDLDAAQAKAEELAHKHGANAFILKPKRDVVTTDL